MSCPQIWNIQQEKDREKEKVGGRPTKLNEIKGDRDLENRTPNAYTLSLAYNIGIKEGRVISDLLQEPIHRASASW